MIVYFTRFFSDFELSPEARCIPIYQTQIVQSTVSAFLLDMRNAPSQSYAPITSPIQTHRVRELPFRGFVRERLLANGAGGLKNQKLGLCTVSSHVRFCTNLVVALIISEHYYLVFIFNPVSLFARSVLFEHPPQLIYMFRN
jgi:hypothetical protein